MTTIEIQKIFLWHPSEEGVCTGIIAVNVSTLVLHWPKVLYPIMSFIKSISSPQTAHCFICHCVSPFNLVCDALQRFYFFPDLLALCKYALLSAPCRCANVIMYSIGVTQLLEWWLVKFKFLLVFSRRKCSDCVKIKTYKSASMLSQSVPVLFRCSGMCITGVT